MVEDIMHAFILFISILLNNAFELIRSSTFMILCGKAENGFAFNKNYFTG